MAHDALCTGGLDSIPVRWDHPQSLTDHIFAALKPTATHSTSLERSETQKIILPVQETDRILKVVNTLSKGPYFHSVYLLGVPYSFSKTVYVGILLCHYYLNQFSNILEGNIILPEMCQSMLLFISRHLSRPKLYFCAFSESPINYFLLFYPRILQRKNRQKKEKNLSLYYLVSLGIILSYLLNLHF